MPCPHCPHCQPEGVLTFLVRNGAADFLVNTFLDEDNPGWRKMPETVEELCSLTAKELLRGKCFGPKRLAALREILSSNGLTLRGDVLSSSTVT